MGLTKKDLQIMISEAVKTTIIKEIKPLIKKTIKEEFYKILDSAGGAQPQPQPQPSRQDDNLSMANLLETNATDDTRQVVGEKIFKDGRGGKFADILNQTADQYVGKSIGNDAGAINEQKEVVLNSNAADPSGVSAQAFDASNLAAKVGYGDGFQKVGAGAKIPGVESTPKRSALKQILNRTEERISEQPVKVSLPTKNPDGRPINLDNVPVEIVQNMMKDYSSLLKKVDSKAKSKRNV